MHRSIPFFETGLRVVALAAVIGGQGACVRSAPLISATNATNLSVLSPAVRTPAVVVAEAPRVVVRDYWGSPRATVLAWAENELYQGLRGAVMRDGTVAYEHILYFSAYSAPNRGAFRQANWYAFSDTTNTGTRLQLLGLLRDQFNCQGRSSCTPYLSYAARITDKQLRNSHDSLVVKVISYDGHETVISLQGGLISSYLATVDSVSAERKTRSKTANN